MQNKIIIILTIILIQFNLNANNNSHIKLKLSDDYSISLSKFFINALPGEVVEINLETTNEGSISGVADFGNLIEKEKGEWEIIAPIKSGNYSITFSDNVSGETLQLALFVNRPATQINGEYLNKYRIGKYPESGYKNNADYNKPEGFIEVTEQNKNLFITPHFQLKQFLCKQKSGWPKYVIIKPKLLIKLELLLAELNKNGNEINTLVIMSGYRTPYYNKLIGNVKYSRHIFGNAADVYVDINGDGVIDDLNNDGKHNMDDENILYKIINSFDNDPSFSELIGGAGNYKKNSRHTFFIHIDTRGYKARW